MKEDDTYPFKPGLLRKAVYQAALCIALRLSISRKRYGVNNTFGGKGAADVIVTLEEIKNYLRVDFEDDYVLLETLLNTA